MLRLKILIIFVLIISTFNYAIAEERNDGTGVTCVKKELSGHTSGLQTMITASNSLTRNMALRLCTAYEAGGHIRMDKLKAEIKKQLNKNSSDEITDSEIAQFLNKHKNDII